MKGRIMAILSVVLVTVLVNGFIFMTVTRRVGNNFSSASQRKMIDVSRYLPFEEGSDLVRIKGSGSQTMMEKFMGKENVPTDSLY